MSARARRALRQALAESETWPGDQGAAFMLGYLLAESSMSQAEQAAIRHRLAERLRATSRARLDREAPV